MIKVLIVEDEQLARRGLHFAFDWNRYGCEVIGEASNGEEGEARIRELSPDIVISDIKMPKKSGLEMMRSLEGEYHGAYIILSGFDEFHYAKEAIDLGVRGYLLKPVDDDELAEVLEKITREILQKREEAGEIKKNLKTEDPANSGILRGFHDKYIARACEMIREEYRTDLSSKIVAERLNISDSYLEKLFRSKTSYTFHNVLTFYRMKAAVEMLENTDRKVYDIAAEVGYSDAKYFSKAFQKIIGIKPTEYRNGYHLPSDSIIQNLDSFSEKNSD